LELSKAYSSSNQDNEAAKNVQMMIEEMKLSYQQSQEEKGRLSEINKSLTQQSIWDKNRKEQLLFEIASLKQRRAELMTVSEIFL